MLQDKKYESKSIFSYSLYIGIALIVSVASNYLILYALRMVVYAFGYDYEQYVILVNSEYLGNLLNIFCTIVAFVFSFMLINRHFNTKISETCSFNSPYRKNSFRLVGFVLGMCIFANIASFVFDNFLKNFLGFEAYQPQLGDNNYTSLSEYAFAIITTAVIPALVEEFAFRGIILGNLRKFGDVPAVIVSAILFALYHGNFVQIPFALIVGIVLGLAVVITDSIWPAIIAHFINNSFSVLANSDTRFNFLIFVFAAYGIFSVINMFLHDDFSYIRKIYSNYNSATRTVKLLLSPTVIIFIAYSFYIASRFVK